MDVTGTDTRRVERPCPNCGVTLNGWSGLRYCGHYVTHAHADCINNLRHRAEKAEEERDLFNNSAEALTDLLEENATLRDALDAIAGMGLSTPAAWDGTDEEWERRRANIMRGYARAALEETTNERDRHKTETP